MVRANSATDSPVAGRSGLDRGLRQLLKRTRHQPQLTPLKLARWSSAICARAASMSSELVLAYPRPRD